MSWWALFTLQGLIPAALLTAWWLRLTVYR